MKIEKLIERIKAGDAEALRTVYETYSQRMRNVCIRITREDEATVSDLVQESFIRAYYSLGKLKDASKFGEWIVAITKNVSLRYLERKQKVQVMPFSSIADGFDVESSLASDSMLEEKELLEIINKLPSGYCKSPKMVISVDANGTGHFTVADLRGNCALNGFRPQVSSQDNSICIVLVPWGDPTVEADCMCHYNVSFKLSNLTSDSYRLTVYLSDFAGKYDSTQPLYEGKASFLPNKSIEMELK